MASEAEIIAVLSDITELYIHAEIADSGLSESFSFDRIVLDSTLIDESCVAVWEERDSAEPAGRWRHTVAVDTDRGVMVLFGGNTGENDTWEFDLSTSVWTKMQPVISPSRRSAHAMVYDRARQRIVMTGGRYLDNKYKEVWEYDVVTGLWAQSEDMPQIRVGHAMAYDTLRQTSVIYGGIADGDPGSIDVLERSSASNTWVSRPSDIHPAPQFGNAMAYDAARSLTVLIGRNATTISVAEWNGFTGTWELQGFAGDVPNVRTNPAVVYDDNRQLIVLMGGEGNRNVWEYDGSVWVQRADINPGGRDEHAGAYDPVNHRVLLSGGILNSATPQRDLLAFDGITNTWSTVWSRSAMGPRSRFGMAYDEAGQRIVAYGGQIVNRIGLSSKFGGGTFIFENDTWTYAAQVTGEPGTRWLMPLVYDSTRQKMMMYGGAFGQGSQTATDQLWELDLGTLEWTDRGAQLPGQRFAHAGAYDRVRQNLVIHGGINASGNRIGDTWIYDPSANSWSTLPQGAVTPGLRNSAGMAFDEHRGVIVLFGGHVGANSAYDNTTWEWNGAQWTDVTPASGNPPARFRPILVYDPNRQTVLMYGGMTNLNSTNSIIFAGRAYNDLWEWNGSTWNRITQDTSIGSVARTESNAVYDVARSRLVHFGGESVRGYPRTLHGRRYYVIIRHVETY